MALPNNPTQAQTVKAIKDLETNKVDSSALSSYLPKSGGTMTGALTSKDITLYSASGDSPRLTFQRGTLTDTYNDWSIYDTAGLLHIQQRGSGSSAWEDRATITQSGASFVGTLSGGTLQEGGTSLSSKYLGISAKAADSDKLDGNDSTYFQQALVSGTNIKTVNGNSLLGSGDITISGGTPTDVQVNGTSITSNNVANLITNTAYNASTNKIATMSDLPSAVTESTVSSWGFTKNAGTITGVQLNGKTVASNGVANVQALPNFSLNISHQTQGNPRPVKFLTVDYNTKATYFKMSATSCHDNGTSYQFLEDIIIGCTTSGTVVCNVYKYCQQAVTYDGATRNYGDVFYVIDTTNKKVDFFILCGQWASSQFTPATKIGNTTIAYITQYTGTATYYSSGTKVWADGDSALYVRTGDLKTVNGNSLIGSGDITITAPTPTNMVTTDTAQTVSGTKTLTGGLKVSGRSVGSGDDEGIVVGRAANNYAGICLGSPSGIRSVFYLTAANKPVWRWNNGSASFDIEHPAKAGTIALTSDLPFTMTLVANATGTAVNIDTLVNNGTLSASEEYLLIPNNTASPTMGNMQLVSTSGAYGYSNYPIMVRPWYYSNKSTYVFCVSFPSEGSGDWFTKTVNYAKIYKITY